MGVVRAAATFESVTGLPEDRTVSDFWFRWDGPTGPTDLELGDLADLIEAFFNVQPTGATSALATYISHEVSRVALESETRLYRYDVLGQPSGSPQLVQPFTLGAGDVTALSLPAEVAACLSFNASLVGIAVEVGATRPQSRRRGRTYIGPLNSKACSLGVNVAGVQRPNPNLLTTLRLAYKEMVEASKNIMPLNAGLFASVYSPTDLAARTVVNTSTDDAFDTQRRRGSDPTAKTNLAVSAQ